MAPAAESITLVAANFEQDDWEGGREGGREAGACKQATDGRCSSCGQVAAVMGQVYPLSSSMPFTSCSSCNCLADNCDGGRDRLIRGGAVLP